MDDLTLWKICRILVDKIDKIDMDIKSAEIITRDELHIYSQNI